MQKWIIRVVAALLILTVLGALGTYVFVRSSVVEMFGGRTELAESDLSDRRGGTYILTNVNILSPSGEAFLSGQEIRIEEGLIAYIGEEADRSGDPQIIDGERRFLVPGFIDSHVHLWKSRNDLLLYVANGVTTVREMHGTDLHLGWKDEVQKGALGPNLFIIAAQLATYNFAEGVWVDMTAERNVVRSDSDVRRTVSSLLEAGFDGFKASSYLSLPAYKAASVETREAETPFVGHIPVAAGLKDLWASTQSEVAHVEEFVKALDREFGGYGVKDADAFLAFVRERSAEVAKNVRDKDIAVTTTLAIIDSFAPQITDLEPTLRSVELAYVNPGVAEGLAMGWLPGTNRYGIPESYKTEGWEERYQTYWTTYAEAQNILFRAFLEADVTLFAGTDANVPVMVPGFSLHEELEAMQAAGMSAQAALKAATSAPADWMGLKTGRIAEGYKADLVLLRDNPLEDISATRSIEMVFVNQFALTRDDLDGLLASVKAANEKSRTEPINAFLP